MSAALRSLQDSARPLVVDLTAMIDVIFILLIFWMTMARLSTEPAGPPIDTPEAGDNPTSELPPKLLTITLLDDGRTVVVGDERAGMDRLPAILEQQALPDNVLVRASAETDCLDLDRLTGFLRKAGIQRVGLATRRPES